MEILKSQLNPRSFPDQKQLDSQQQEIAKNTPNSLGEAFSIAKDLDWVSSAAERIKQERGFTVDYDWKLSQKEWDEAVKGIDPKYQDRLLDAVSPEHLSFIANRIREEQKMEQGLANMGVKGIGVRFLTALLDPSAIGISIASDAALAPWVIGTKSTRLASILGSATSAGLGNALVDSSLYKGNKTYDASDVVFSTLVGASLGSIVGAARKLDNIPAEEQQYNRVLRNAIHEIVNENNDLGESTVGAMRAKAVPSTIYDLDVNEAIANSDDVEAFAGKVRYSTTARLKQSPNKATKYAGTFLAEDGVVGGKHSVALKAQVDYEIDMNKFRRVEVPSYHSWKKRQRIEGSLAPWLKDAELRNQFSSLVARAVRGEAIDDQDVNRVADMIRTQNYEILAEAKKAGVHGFEDVEPNPNYLTRQHSMAAYDEANRLFGEEQVVGFIGRAIKSASEGIDDALSHRIAKVLFKRIRTKGLGIDSSTRQLFGRDQLDDIEEILRSSSMEDSEIKQIVDDLEHVFRQKDSSKDPRARRRITMDENYKEILVDSMGRKHTFHVYDLLENNSDVLHTIYLRRMRGLIAFAKAGIRSEKDWNDKIIKPIIEESDKLPGSSKSKQAQLKADLKRVNFLRDAILGRPLEDDPGGVKANAMRMIRDFNFVNIMNQAGFAQLADIGNIITELGFKTLIQHVDEFGNIIKRVVKGDLDARSPLFKEIEENLGAFGADRLLHQPTARTDELGFGFSEGFLHDVDTTLQYGKKLTSDISLMSPINIGLQRITAVGVAQKFLHLALKKQLSKGDKLKLKVLGLGGEMLERVLKQIKIHAKYTENPITGRKLKVLNLENWDDLEALDSFKYAVNRYAGHIVQKNFIGENSELFSSTMGKTLAQFRTFVLTAWEKQTLYGIYMAQTKEGALDTVFRYFWGMFFGGMAYVLQQTVNTPDKTELKKKLEPKKIALAAFAKSGSASLIPSIYDSVAKPFGYDAFSYARSTGLEADIFYGNPTINTLTKAKNFVNDTIITNSVNNDYRFSRSDLDNIKALVPFSNAIGIKAILDSIRRDLPYKSLNNK